MSGHTPGPWTIYPDVTNGDESGAYGCIDGVVTGNLDLHLVTVWADTDELHAAAEANARLIAAAPDLYEACRQIVAFVDQVNVGYSLEIRGVPIDHTILNRANDLACIALAKAEGKA